MHIIVRVAGRGILGLQPERRGRGQGCGEACLRVDPAHRPLPEEKHKLGRVLPARPLPSISDLYRLYIGSISEAPTACPLRGYGHAGTQNDRLFEAVILSTGTPIPAQWTCRRRCRYRARRPRRTLRHGRHGACMSVGAPALSELRLRMPLEMCRGTPGNIQRALLISKFLLRRSLSAYRDAHSSYGILVMAY